MNAIKEGYKARVAEELQKARSAPIDPGGILVLQGVIEHEALGSLDSKTGLSSLPLTDVLQHQQIILKQGRWVRTYWMEI